MQTLIAFLLVALGIVIDATYNNIRRRAEYNAFRDGYRQAQKEEKIRTNNTTKQQPQFYRPVVNTAATEPEPKPEPKKNKVKIPESFMYDLHKNGRAAVCINNGGVK